MTYADAFERSSFFNASAPLKESYTNFYWFVDGLLCSHNMVVGFNLRKIREFLLSDFPFAKIVCWRIILKK